MSTAVHQNPNPSSGNEPSEAPPTHRSVAAEDAFARAAATPRGDDVRASTAAIAGADGRDDAAHARVKFADDTHTGATDEAGARSYPPPTFEGRPTPENSAGPAPAPKRGYCGHSSDEDGARTLDHASSEPTAEADKVPGAKEAREGESARVHRAFAPAAAKPEVRANRTDSAEAIDPDSVEAPPRTSSPAPWMRNVATGRRSARPRGEPSRRFRASSSSRLRSEEEDVAAPSAADRAATNTPPPLYLRETDATAAELLAGSPGAGMAAADTLLMLLMTAGADAEDAAAPKPAAKKRAAGTKPKAPKKSKLGGEKASVPPKKRAAASSAAAEAGDAKPAKRAKPSVASEPAAPEGAATAARTPDASVAPSAPWVPAVVPDTAMYNAASAAAAKRRLLPSRGGGRQKVHRPWTLPEVHALVEGVSHYGRGQWADIKSLQANGVSAALAGRSAVDLKDKWRNLLRIAMLPVLYKRREATEVPQATLAKVRELAAQKTAPARGEHGAGRGGGENGSGPGGSGDAAADAAAPKGARRSKHHSPWTLAESRALVDGVETCAGCRWTVIKRLGLESLERRTAMDLKDKWRNLLQLASLPSQSRRKAETPPELLARVLELEAEFGVARRKGRKSEKPPDAAATNGGAVVGAVVGAASAVAGVAAA